MAARFASRSEEEIRLLIDEKDSKNTKRSTKVCTKIFTDYLKEKALLQPENKQQLASILTSFYVEARKSNGELYSKSSLNAIRFGLNRHFKNTKGTDIIKDPAFVEANKVFLAQCVDLKRQGLGKTQHKPSILENDLRKLYECKIFGFEDPQTLQNKVFFEIMLFFCRRSCQNLRQLKISDFSVGVDDKGSRFVYKRTDDLTKNKREVEDVLEGEKMYERPGLNCPVASFQLYIDHLNPNNPFLFQRPKKLAKIGLDDISYDNVAVSERTLAEKMKILSQQAGLSNIYTNQSIRATSPSILDKAIFATCHIIPVSEPNCKSFCQQTDMNTRQEMSESIIPLSIEDVPSTSVEIVPNTGNEHEKPTRLFDGRFLATARDLLVSLSSHVSHNAVLPPLCDTGSYWRALDLYRWAVLDI